MARIFISYARIDEEFTLKLAKDLRQRGVDCWLDQLDIPPGARWDDEVETALRESPYFLLVS